MCLKMYFSRQDQPKPMAPMPTTQRPARHLASLTVSQGVLRDEENGSQQGATPNTMLTMTWGACSHKSGSSSPGAWASSHPVLRPWRSPGPRKSGSPPPRPPPPPPAGSQKPSSNPSPTRMCGIWQRNWPISPAQNVTTQQEPDWRREASPSPGHHHAPPGSPPCQRHRCARPMVYPATRSGIAPRRNRRPAR